jgi:hypothetical protein
LGHISAGTSGPSAAATTCSLKANASSAQKALPGQGRLAATDASAVITPAAAAAVAVCFDVACRAMPAAAAAGGGPYILSHPSQLIIFTIPLKPFQNVVGQFLMASCLASNS